jgi:MscS family membrane protein
VRLGHSQHLALFRGLDSLIRSLFWILGLLVFLQNQGVQMGAIYASLAGAGIGVGLALRGPISNFLNYLTILLDEPFRIGHFIRFDNVLGTVERVGIRSTHVRSLDGERIVISNEELLTKTIQNFGDLPKRRIATIIGVLYQTPVQTVKAIPGLIESVIRQHPPAEFDRCHFTRFADSALEFEFVYLFPTMISWCI